MEFLSIQEAADRLGVSTRRIGQYCAAGRLGQRTVGARAIRYVITTADVARFERQPAGRRKSHSTTK